MSALFEREQELAAVAGIIARAVAGGADLVLVEGPPGIGKSRLIAEFRQLATQAGIPVLTARGGYLERDFPYGVVHQLFDTTVLGESKPERLLSGPASPAAAVFAPSAQPGPGSGDSSFAALHGLYWLTANVAADAPLVVLVDDLHWCDRPSLRYVAYLARRLQGSQTTLVLGLRSDDAGTDPALVAELETTPDAVRLHPDPLSQDGVASLIRERFGCAPDPAFAAACLAATGGNPLLLRQLASSLSEQGVLPAADQVSAIARIGPRAISRTVLLRLHRLPEPATSVAQAVAVLGDGAELSTVAAMAGVPRAEATAATAALARTEILTSKFPIGFVHPLVRDAVYHDLPAGERELRHARAARVLADAGASAEQVAAQLLHAPPQGDAWVVDMLVDAATQARRKGAGEFAVALLRRALAEPPKPALRDGLLLELGIAETLTSGPSAADHLREALGGLRDPLARARAAAVLTRTLLFTAPATEAAAVARSAAAEVPPELADERQALQALVLAAARYGVGADGAESRTDLEEVHPEGSGPGAKMLTGMLSFSLAMAGADAERCVRLANDALAEDILIKADAGFFPVPPLMVLTMADREEAMTGWAKLRDLAHRHGSLLGALSVNLWSSFTLLWRGDLRDAEDRLAAAAERFADWGRTRSRQTYGPAFLADALRMRGDLAGARAVLDTGQDDDDGSDGLMQLLRSRAAILLEEGRYDEALEVTERLERGFSFPTAPAWMPWRSLRATALAAVGRTEEALGYVAEELAAARTFGAPGAIGRALRVQAVVQPGLRIDCLREAVAFLERSTARFELAGALADLGCALRLERRPTQAREPLRHALELADRCGAEGLARRVRTELYAAGVRPRRSDRTGPGSLTASERRVAELAAGGLTNKDIAQRLYVTPKTVELHLSSCYRKLGIRSRQGLPHALAGHRAEQERNSWGRR